MDDSHGGEGRAHEGEGTAPSGLGGRVHEVGEAGRLSKLCHLGDSRGNLN